VGDGSGGGDEDESRMEGVHGGPTRSVASGSKNPQPRAQDTFAPSCLLF
jgi:hypothetical protein